VTCLVDGRKVAGGTVSFTRDAEATDTFTGGGYTWEVHAVPATPELIERRRKQAPDPQKRTPNPR
jgi:hypothetical protein